MLYITYMYTLHLNDIRIRTHICMYILYNTYIHIHTYAKKIYMYMYINIKCIPWN